MINMESYEERIAEVIKVLKNYKKRRQDLMMPSAPENRDISLDLIKAGKLRSAEDIMLYEKALNLSLHTRILVAAYIRLRKENVTVTLRRLAGIAGLELRDTIKAYQNELKPLLRKIERNSPFSEEVMIIRDYKIVNEHERKELAKIRDSILSEVISGKFKLREEVIGAMQKKTGTTRQRAMRYLNKWGITRKDFYNLR